jgi:hypothetical protein
VFEPVTVEMALQVLEERNLLNTVDQTEVMEAVVVQ